MPRWSRVARGLVIRRNLSSNWAVVPGSVVAPWRPALGPETASHHRPNFDPAVSVARYRSSPVSFAGGDDCSAVFRACLVLCHAYARSHHVSSQRWTRARHRCRQRMPASGSASTYSTKRTDRRRPRRIPNFVSFVLPRPTRTSSRRPRTRTLRRQRCRCSSLATRRFR